MEYRGYIIKVERVYKGTKWVAKAQHGKHIIISSGKDIPSKATLEVKSKIDDYLNE